MILGTAIGGCGSKERTLGMRRTPPRLLRAFVRLDALIARDPLQQDVRRLRAAEAGLRSLTYGTIAGEKSEPSAGEAASLPPLAVQAGDDSPAARAAEAVRAQHRRAARELLVQTAAQSLGEYAIEREQRHQSLVEQQRAQLLAQDADKAAESERHARDAVDLQAHDKILGLADQEVEVQSRISVLNAQLVDPVTFLVPILDADTIANQIKTLKAEPKAIGISMQARLTAQNAVQAAQLAALQKQLDAVHLDRIADSDAAAKGVYQNRLNFIQSELDKLDDAVKVRALLSGQDEEMRQILAVDEQVAQDAMNGKLKTESRADGRAGSTAGTVRLATLFGSGNNRTMDISTKAAADRVARQREHLLRFIRADMAAAVRDMAQERSIDVVIVDEAADNVDRADSAKSSSHHGSGKSIGVSPMRTMGRKDMTAQFEQWILPGDTRRSGEEKT